MMADYTSIKNQTLSCFIYSRDYRPLFITFNIMGDNLVTWSDGMETPFASWLSLTTMYPFVGVKSQIKAGQSNFQISCMTLVWGLKGIHSEFKKLFHISTWKFATLSHINCKPMLSTGRRSFEFLWWVKLVMVVSVSIVKDCMICPVELLTCYTMFFINILRCFLLLPVFKDENSIFTYAGYAFMLTYWLSFPSFKAYVNVYMFVCIWFCINYFTCVKLSESGW